MLNARLNAVCIHMYIKEKCYEGKTVASANVYERMLNDLIIALRNSQIRLTLRYGLAGTNAN